jgi:hypothetical protein
MRISLGMISVMSSYGVVLFKRFLILEKLY